MQVIYISEPSILQIYTSSYCLYIIHEKHRGLSALWEHLKCWFVDRGWIGRITEVAASHVPVLEPDTSPRASPAATGEGNMVWKL